MFSGAGAGEVCKFFDGVENGKLLWESEEEGPLLTSFHGKRLSLRNKNNYINMERTVFNKAQLEMLDIMAAIRSDEELEELKHTISEFYAKRADQEMEKLWQSGRWNEQTLKELGNAHYRTPYRQ